MLAFILTLVGAATAAVGTFLPAADMPVNFPLSGNALIQHADGVIAIAAALLAVICASIPAFNQGKYLDGLMVVVLGGGAIIAIAVLYGTNIPVEPNNQLSEAILKRNPPTAGPGVWATGVGGTIIAIAGLIGIGATPDPDRPATKGEETVR